MIKLNDRQNKMMEVLKGFLSTDIGSSGISIDSDITYISIITKIYSNNTGVYLVGYTFGRGRDTDRIEYNQIKSIYHSAIKNDESFKNYTINEGI